MSIRGLLAAACAFAVMVAIAGGAFLYAHAFASDLGAPAWVATLLAIAAGVYFVRALSILVVVAWAWGAGEL